MENELFSTEDIQLSNSSLYNLKPMELGTFQCESMTSYITRLAEVHCIKLGTLINKVIAPTLNKDFILQSAKRGGNRFYDGAKALNGVSKSSKDLVLAIEKLTFRNDLINLNLTKWEEVFTSRGLLKESLSFKFNIKYQFNNFQDGITKLKYPILVVFFKELNIFEIRFDKIKNSYKDKDTLYVDNISMVHGWLKSKLGLIISNVNLEPKIESICKDKSNHVVVHSQCMSLRSGGKATLEVGGHTENSLPILGEL
ncbi:hypothetical protein [Peribacillus simplex]|uniref:hypothetical protein n=1 Tax=Peribacillus simplex TaxID=1478 RepID=UPI000BA7A5B8|nr:hypothetical protein [Peribacillus simplex]PAL13751.1 hypothetical protein B8W99_09350 [Peribacillus simplex]